MEFMRLIDDHQIDFGPPAAGDRLDAANLDRLLAIGPRMNSLQNADE